MTEFIGDGSYDIEDTSVVFCDVHVADVDYGYNSIENFDEGRYILERIVEPKFHIRTHNMDMIDYMRNVFDETEVEKAVRYVFTDMAKG